MSGSVGRRSFSLGRLLEALLPSNARADRRAGLARPLRPCNGRDRTNRPVQRAVRHRASPRLFGNRAVAASTGPRNPARLQIGDTNSRLRARRLGQRHPACQGCLRRASSIGGSAGRWSRCNPCTSSVRGRCSWRTASTGLAYSGSVGSPISCLTRGATELCRSLARPGSSRSRRPGFSVRAFPSARAALPLPTASICGLAMNSAASCVNLGSAA